MRDVNMNATLFYK